jgi:hypothetical protein
MQPGNIQTEGGKSSIMRDTKWEYLMEVVSSTILRPYEPVSLQQKLDTLGRQGWELTLTLAFCKSQQWLIFKRPE